MNRFYLCVSVVALCIGVVPRLRTDHHHSFYGPNETVAEYADGAFRDGMYLGRLAAERDAEPHVAIGRWATSEDRASFAAVYHRGYSEELASRTLPTMRAPRAE
jgi:hypothetical protein